MALDSNGNQIGDASLLIEQVRPDSITDSADGGLTFTARNIVELEGAALPDRGIATEVRQKIVTSWPPGAREPIHQILGVELPPLRFTGTFDDAAMASTGLTQSLIGRLTRMVAEGFPVRVVWGTVWEYEGHMTMFRPIWRLDNACDWEFELAPTSSNLLTRTDYKVQARRQRNRSDAERLTLQVGIISTSIWAVQRNMTRTQNLTSIVLGAT